MKRALAPVAPIFTLIELHFRRFQLATINPLAPQVPEIVHRIAELERPTK